MSINVVKRKKPPSSAQGGGLLAAPSTFSRETASMSLLLFADGADPSRIADFSGRYPGVTEVHSRHQR